MDYFRKMLVKARTAGRLAHEDRADGNASLCLVLNHPTDPRLDTIVQVAIHRLDTRTFKDAAFEMSEALEKALDGKIRARDELDRSVQ